MAWVPVSILFLFFYSPFPQTQSKFLFKLPWKIPPHAVHPLFLISYKIIVGISLSILKLSFNDRTALAFLNVPIGILHYGFKVLKYIIGRILIL